MTLSELIAQFIRDWKAYPVGSILVLILMVALCVGAFETAAMVVEIAIAVGRWAIGLF